MQEYIFSTEQVRLTSAPNSPTTSKAKNYLPILDWKQSLDLCCGDEKTLLEIISIFDLDLKVSKEKIAKYYKASDTIALRAELHRVRGGLAYLCLPQLDKAFSDFHEAVKEIPQETEKIKLLYEKLEQVMKLFWSYVKKLEHL